MKWLCGSFHPFTPVRALLSPVCSDRLERSSTAEEGKGRSRGCGGRTQKDCYHTCTFGKKVRGGTAGAGKVTDRTGHMDALSQCCFLPATTRKHHGPPALGLEPKQVTEPRYPNSQLRLPCCSQPHLAREFSNPSHELYVLIYKASLSLLNPLMIIN